eukprot:311942-Pleurochrysis_carterae.AAC.1
MKRSGDPRSRIHAGKVVWACARDHARARAVQASQAATRCQRFAGGLTYHCERPPPNGSRASKGEMRVECRHAQFPLSDDIVKLRIRSSYISPQARPSYHLVPKSRRRSFENKINKWELSKLKRLGERWYSGSASSFLAFAPRPFRLMCLAKYY